jgi:hypothetical protein
MEQLGHKDHLGASRDEVSEDDGRATGGVQVLSAPAPVRVASEVRASTARASRRHGACNGRNDAPRPTSSRSQRLQRATPCHHQQRDGCVRGRPKVRIRRFWRLVLATQPLGMSSRDGYHRKERVRIDLGRSKFHLLSLPWRLPTLAQTLLVEAAPGGYTRSKQSQSSGLYSSTASKPAIETLPIVSSAINLP